MFETSEMLAKFITSTNILDDSWNVCNHASTVTSEPGFVISQNGPIGFIGFSGLKDFRHGFGPTLMDTVPLQANGLFSGLGRDRDDGLDDEPIMVHAGFLQLFLVVFSNPSFQNQTKLLLENSKAIMITGHSIGGALASLTTLYLLSNHQSIPTPPPQILCITFGSPLLANKSLSKSLIRQKWASNFCHIVLRQDIVPRLLFAPLDIINNTNHINSLLQYIQSSIPLPEEVKSQLFNFTLDYTKKTGNGENGNSAVFWPFGSYLLCSDEGALCVDDSMCVVKLMYLMMGMGDSDSCFEDHLKYGGCVERLSYKFLMNDGFITQGDVLENGYEAGLALAVKPLGLASQESVAEQAKDCLKQAKQIGLPPNLSSAKLAITLAKITPHRAQIEWYKTRCDESDNQLGYYDSFKQRQASKKDHQVNMFRIKLADFWDKVIIKIDNNELPHDFHKRRKFINASHFYQLLVEPLDIAEYYRNGEHLKKGHYLRNGRHRRHEVFSKWWRERDVVEEESKRSKSASLTQDSCFWARVEEARDLLEKVRTERNPRNLDLIWESINDFERYARQLVESMKVSCDVVAMNSSYSLWIDEVSELRSQLQPFQFHAGFLDGNMVP